jgi:hypothetical protein
MVWKMVPLCLMCCIWNERNARCFEGKARSFEEILHYFLFTLYIWAAGWLASLVISFQDFLYISCVLRVAPLCTFYIYILTYQKKKKNEGNPTNSGRISYNKFI